MDTSFTRPPVQRMPLLAGSFALFLLVYLASEASAFSTRLTLAALLGAFAGFALYHAAFGFTAAWRAVITERRGAGLRAQFLLLAVTGAATFPLIAWGLDIDFTILGQDYSYDLRTSGFLFSFGLSSAIGAFMFGFGMQLGGGCGSGTLFTVGGGSSRMLVTLAAFIAGSLIATAHLPQWNTLPRLPRFSFITEFGPLIAFLMMGAVLAVLAWITIRIEKNAHGALAGTRPMESFFFGRWSLLAGVIALALVEVFSFLILNRPWGITSAFALWGAKIAWATGIPVETWPYWVNQSARITERSVFSDATSVMNFGIIIGAFMAACLAGRFSPKRALTATEIGTALVGGLLMGYGARLAFGCNIGGFLGGIISGSLHGWGWFVFGFAGSCLGVAARQRLGMT